jgi:hypothetical protein
MQSGLVMVRLPVPVWPQYRLRLTKKEDLYFRLCINVSSLAPIGTEEARMHLGLECVGANKIKSK